MYNKGERSSANSLNSSSSAAASTTTTTTTSNNAAANNSAASGGSNDRIEWSRATILGFIEDYRRQRVLWDPNTKGYHIKQTKYEALKNLGQKYNAEIRSIRSKIKSLRSSFHREHGKVINGRRKGLNYQPMWFAYDAIRFILDGETGDSDEAEGPKNDTTDSPSESNNNNNSVSLMAWSGHATDAELLEERKISSRDIEHFNNHFLALGLQARHPMAMLAAVEAAAAASALSAVAQEKRQEQDYALKQQQQQNTLSDKDDRPADEDDDDSSPPQRKIIELSSTNSTSNDNNNNNSAGLNTIASSSIAAATLKPIAKPFASPKPSSPLGVAPTITTTAASPPRATQSPHPQARLSSTTNTCSPENYNVLHGSRSLDENSAAAIGNNAAATAIPSLPITAVARTSDFDGSEYCNISAEDVKTEIFESDSNEMAMLESTRTSTPVPLNYHKNATDLTMQRHNSLALSNAAFNVAGNSRKRKAPNHSNANHNTDGGGGGAGVSPSKLQQHSNDIHSRQCGYINNNNNANNGGAGYSTTLFNENNINNNNNSSNGHNHSASGSSGNNPSTSSKPGNTPIDEYGVFGEYVAITIRKLKTSKAKIVVKHLINNLLYEAEMGKYDQGISSCKEPPELYKM